jgi:uncharacterized protein (DUF4415 family)
MSRKPLTDKAREVRELAREDIADFRPAEEVLPTRLVERLPRRPGERGQGRRLPKVALSLRLSPEVVAHFRATGPGWQRRIDDALKEWVAGHRQR